MASSPALAECARDSLRGRTITVVGAGVIGLTSALRLRETGADVDVVSSRDVPMVSLAACAFWLPAWVPGRTADMLGGTVDRSIVEPSWRAIAEHLHEYGAVAGIRAVTNKEYLEEGQEDPPDWLQALLAPSEIREADLTCDGRVYKRKWTFDSVVVDMTIHLPWLHERAEAAGITFRDERLTTIDAPARQRSVDLIVNCSGLSSRHLVGDTALAPVRGHLLHFDADPERIASMEAVAINEYYLIPRIDDVVVGGLLREEVDPDRIIATESREDEALVLSKVDVLSRMAGAGSPTILRRNGRSSVGLRPRRRGGMRLETDRAWAAPVVHNYGHGGGGVTLAWGCADRVVELACAELAPG